VENDLKNVQKDAKGHVGHIDGKKKKTKATTELHMCLCR